MAHTQADKKRIQARINRLKGQLDSVAELVEAGDECYKVMQVLGSCRGALNGLMGEVVEGHITSHIVEAVDKRQASAAGKEVSEILKSFWR